MNNEILVLEKNKYALNKTFAERIIALEENIKNLKAVEDELKEALLKEMADNEVSSVSFKNLTISYVKPYQKEEFDKKKFREENESVYNDYVSFTTVKGCVKINIKKDKKGKE